MNSLCRLTSLLLLSHLAATTVAAAGPPAPHPTAEALEFFEKRVRPILVNQCYTCHSANTNSKGGLRVDDRNGLIQGGGSGPAVVPGDPENSLLIQAVNHAEDAPKMPPKKRLSPEEVADLTQWVKDGAAWPEAKLAAAVGKPNAKYDKLRETHWAWQPVAKVAAPNVQGASWVRDDLDRFILARLEQEGLKPVGDADPQTLLRRLTFDLTGLPPTPEEIVAFVNDDSHDALDKLVDRLLASPAFGERWGRHWLDVARYGESTGSSRNIPYPHAWRYRDYVINAINKDKPFDQFIREQVAGDLLPAGSPEEKDEHLIATGFLALGVKDVNQRFKVRFIMDNVDEQIDTVSRSVLGVTASCARCHDHKFDPIPTADYYALAGIFQSSDLCAGVRNKMGGGGLDYYDTQLLLHLGPKSAAAAEPNEKIAAATKAVAKARAELVAIRDSADSEKTGPDGRPKLAAARQKLNRLQAELIALSDPAVNGAKLAFGVRDAKTVSDTQIRIRGEAEKLGPTVPRGFLTLLQFPDQPKVNPSQSGRLELAQWLTSEKNPLTPRVMANRVWQNLFGEGLVKSVDNFGISGDVPSHPELLDHLATQFVRDGWSVKTLVKRVVLSRAYRLSSENAEANDAVDPGNRLVWRHTPRRLHAEEIRDATLAAAGTLNLTPPEASPAKDMKVTELRNNEPRAKELAKAARESHHRSLYLPLLRQLTPTSLEVFDFAEQGMVTGHRDTTTVATQALYLLNDPFVRRESLSLAGRLLQRTDLDDKDRVDLAYRLTVSRPATAAEIARIRGFLADYESAASVALASSSSSSTPKAQPIALASVSTTDTSDAGSQTTADAAKPKKKPAPLNPDDVEADDEPVVEEVLPQVDAKTAAWASFCQALLGTAEFRYVP
ncbi:Planctomycete cytochrome C [Singulisphaera sp. GP187]|uniref:PSD1 and planctomycete cytochrome C domain-containing protein n=1 Tax=Singulisphaera sp. GP187 TaxID=1882752 RepID=UPI0009298618|nr:PSD1 and planctomycete cytochrome C domain-containing protein [Singulisphaera sp. GP187]SIO27855.1 Planctomycete cytochrome C [Singulisphaera sp. GP187]